MPLRLLLDIKSCDGQDLSVTSNDNELLNDNNTGATSYIPVAYSAKYGGKNTGLDMTSSAGGEDCHVLETLYANVKIIDHYHAAIPITRFAPVGGGETPSVYLNAFNLSLNTSVVPLTSPDWKKLKFHLDSGANINIISADWCVDLGLEMQTVDKLVITTNNGRVYTDKAVDLLLQTIDRDFVVMRFFVLPNLGKIALMGTNMSEVGYHFSFTPSFKGQQIDHDLPFFDGEKTTKIYHAQYADDIMHWLQPLLDENDKIRGFINSEWDGAFYEPSYTQEDLLKVKTRIWNIPAKFKDEWAAQSAKLIDDGILEEIDDANAACQLPLVIVEQVDKVRFCIDASPINKYIPTPPISFTSTWIAVNRLSGRPFISSFDIKGAFNAMQWRFNPNHKYPFISIGGRKYRYKGMPFGLADAPYKFTTFMIYILGDYEQFSTYFDNLLVASRTLAEHVEDIKLLFSILKRYNIRLNSTKNEILIKQTTVLGYTVTSSYTTVNIEKIVQINNFPTPTNLKESQQVLGLINYVLKYLTPDTKPIVRTLIKLVNSFDEKRYSPSQQEQIRAVLCMIKAKLTHVVMHSKLPDETVEVLYITTDASEGGIGGYISYVNNCGYWTMFDIFSVTLTPTQRNYTVTKKELFAVVTALTKWQNIVRGRKIIVLTDHAALVSQFGVKLIAERSDYLWWTFLSQFHITLQYIEGSKNYFADFLSRFYIIPTNVTPHAFRATTRSSGALDLVQLIDLPKRSKLPARKNEPAAVAATIVDPVVVTGANAMGTIAPSTKVDDIMEEGVSIAGQDMTQVDGNSGCASTTVAPLGVISHPLENSPLVEVSSSDVNSLGCTAVDAAKIAPTSSDDADARDLSALTSSADEKSTGDNAEGIAENEEEAEKLEVPDVGDKNTVIVMGVAKNDEVDAILRDKQQEEVKRKQLLLLKEAHRDHANVNAMIYRIDVWGKRWEGYKKDCLEYQKKCLICQKCNVLPSTYLKMSSPPGDSFMETLEMDIMVPNLTPEHKAQYGSYLYVLVLVDVFSGYTFLRLLKSKSAEAVARAMITVFTEFGPPRIIITDNGGEFTAKKIATILKLFETKHYLGFRGIKHATGKVERRIRDVRKLLSKMLIEGEHHISSWPDYLFFVQYWLNSRWSRTTNMSPFFLAHARAPNLIFSDDMMLDLDKKDYKDTEVFEKANRLQRWFANRMLFETHVLPMAINEKTKYQQKLAQEYNKKHKTTDKTFPIGSYVRWEVVPLNGLDLVNSDVFVVVHHNARGYKLRYLGGCAAQLLDARYPHQSLHLCEDQEYWRTRDENTHYVAAVKGMRTVPAAEKGKKATVEYLITPLGKPDEELWMDYLEEGLINAYKQAVKEAPKDKKATAVYTVNIDPKKHPLLFNPNYVDSDTEP